MAVPLVILSHYAWFQPESNTVAANVWLYEMILIAYAGLLLWALGGRAVQFLQFWPLRYLGRISYTFYLVHTAALILVRRHVHHYSIGNIYAFAAALLFSTISWYVIEQPILHMDGRRIGPPVRSERHFTPPPPSAGSSCAPLDCP
jgi:peptidoglycan/LPS O-acetylase OafA/YrhL